MRNLPNLPDDTVINFIYRSNEYVNLVEVNNKIITFYLWDEIGDEPNHIIKFPIEHVRYDNGDIVGQWNNYVDDNVADENGNRQWLKAHMKNFIKIME